MVSDCLRARENENFCKSEPTMFYCLLLLYKCRCSPGLESPPELVDDEGGEVVEPLADGVEHDEAQRDADHGVHHGEELAPLRLGGGVTVACAGVEWNGDDAALFIASQGRKGREGRLTIRRGKLKSHLVRSTEDKLRRWAIQGGLRTRGIDNECWYFGVIDSRASLDDERSSTGALTFSSPPLPPRTLRKNPLSANLFLFLLPFLGRSLASIKREGRRKSRGLD